MEKLKSTSKSRINKIRKFPADSCLAFEKYGKSEDIMDYTEREISEMMLGIYKYTRTLLVDDCFLDLTKVTKTKCVLERVTYYKKPNLEDYKTNSHNSINNIRTFYVKDYFLITDEKFFGTREHKITRYLHKIGFLRQGRNEFRGLYGIANEYKTLMLGEYPKDLFHPIKRYINGLFFNDDYRISEFVLDSEIKIHNGDYTNN